MFATVSQCIVIATQSSTGEDRGTCQPAIDHMSRSAFALVKSWGPNGPKHQPTDFGAKAA